ncbi:MAG: hypothetical protein QXE29_03090 [Candidatus Hadarchaeales archaeon]
MREFLYIFFSTWFFGPVGGTACASLEGFQAEEILLLISFCNVLIAFLWLLLAELLFRRLKPPFHLGKGSTLTSLGLLAFSLGSMVAVMTAYGLGVGRKAFPIIAPCSVASGILWTLGALGLLTLFPPFWLYMGALVVALFLLSLKLYSNRESLRSFLRNGRVMGLRSNRSQD